MTVDYIFSNRLDWSNPDSSFDTGTEQHWGSCFAPNSNDSSKDQFIVADRTSEILTTIQRSAVSGVFNGTQSTITPSVSPRVVEKVVFAPGATWDKDQIAASDASGGRILLYGRNASGLFASTSPESIITFSGGENAIVFCQHPTDRNKDQIGMRLGGTAIGFAQRNSSTGLFDSSSTKITLSVSSSGTADGSCFAPNLSDRNKDLAIFSGLFVQRNSSTGLFDAGSTQINPSSPKSFTNCTVIVYAPHGSDRTKDQLIGTQDNSDTLILLQRNSSTGLFDDSSSVQTFAVHDFARTLEFVPHRSKQNLDFIFTGALNSDDFRVQYRNSSTGLFDSSSRTETFQVAGVTFDSTTASYTFHNGDNSKDCLSVAYLNGEIKCFNVRRTLTTVDANNTLVEENLPIFTGAEDLQFQDNEIIVLNPVAYFRYERFCAKAVLDFFINFVRNTNTDSTINAKLTFQTDGEVTGDFIIRIGAGQLLDLSASTRTTFTEHITLGSTSTVVVAGNLNLTAFTFANGTTVQRAAGDTNSYTITVANNPGIVAGTGITISSPQATFTISGVPAGGIFTIWDDEISDPQDLGTALLTVNPTTGGNINYVGTGGNQVVLQFVPNTGDSLNYQELNLPAVVPNQSQTLDISSNLEPEDNL